MVPGQFPVARCLLICRADLLQCSELLGSLVLTERLADALESLSVLTMLGLKLYCCSVRKILVPVVSRVAVGSSYDCALYRLV